jgi:hypothetical protein
MGVGVTQVEPITAMRAVLRIEAAEVVASKFTDQKGREQKQFATELSVLSGAGGRNGETFSEWFSFLATGESGPKTKIGQMLTAALGDSAKAETLEELAEKLVGKMFAAQIGTSKDGQYSRVVHDTIAPAPARAVEQGGNGTARLKTILRWTIFPSRRATRRGLWSLSVAPGDPTKESSHMIANHPKRRTSYDSRAPV